MARGYHVDVAAHAADADRKWIDNLLSHFDVPGVDGGRQGVARRLTLLGIYRVAMIRRLTRELGLSTSVAVSLAEQLFETDSVHVDLGPHLQVRFDRHAFERDVERATLDAAESLAPARRGRPPARG
ncbi:MAG TPA: hypothetical protein VGM67_11705 [Gemmatimonadaceae bacterium]|jgi:hypothetical protein